MADTDATTPYDYQTAQALLKQKQSLAQALMSTQAPASGQVVPGGPNGFYVGNKWGGLNAALSKALGAAMMKSSMADQKADTQKSNASLLQALSNAQSPVSQVTNTPVTIGATNADGSSKGLTAGSSDPSMDNSAGASSGNDDAPTEDSQGNLLPVTSQQDYISQTSRPKTMAENMPNYLQMAQSGPVGGELAGAMLTPHKQEFSRNPITGALDVGDTVTGQAHTAIDGTGGDPKLVEQALQLRGQTDPKNPNAIIYLNQLETKAGLPLSTPQTLSGSQGTPLQNAQAAEAGANTAFTAGPRTANTNAETNFTQGPRTANTNADTTLKGATTLATTTKTGIDAVDALSGAQQDVAVKQNDLDRTTRAMALAANGSGGNKGKATLGDLQNMVGSNPAYAEYKALLSVDGLSSIKNAMQSRMGQQEFNKLFPSQVSTSMPSSAVMQLLDLNRKLQLTDLGVARNKVQNLSTIVQPSGVTPGAGTQSAGNGFTIPGQ